MRIRNITIWCIFTLLMVGCGQRPEKIQTPNKINIPNQFSEKNPEAISENFNRDSTALWFVTSNYTNGGSLARLDLRTGVLKLELRKVGRDAVIHPDQKGLFLLNRMDKDSVSILEGEDAKITGYFALPDFTSPQFAARDSEGRVWVTTMQQNVVQVLSSDLNEELGTVDLSSFAVDGASGSYASLAQVKAVGKDQIAVTAQRLHRGSSVWQPDPLAGLAVIDIHTLQPSHLEYISTLNPIPIYAQNGEVFVMGAGDLSPKAEGMASLGRFHVSRKVSKLTSEYSFTVLDAHLSSIVEEPALIARYTSENKSCLQIGMRKVYCESGSYVFNKLLRVGDYLYTSYVKDGSAELWIVAINGSEIRKTPMNLPIQSMAFGP